MNSYTKREQIYYVINKSTKKIFHCQVATHHQIKKVLTIT